MVTKYDEYLGYKPIKNIDKTFEKMQLLWEWNKHKKACNLATRVIIHLVKGGEHPKGYSRDDAYLICIHILQWDYKASVWKKA